MTQSKLPILLALLLFSASSQAQSGQTDPRIYWQQEYTKDSHSRGLSCQAIKALEEKAAKCPFKPMQDSYAALIKRLRTADYESLKTGSFRQNYADPSYYEQGDQADGLHTGDESPEAFTERMKATNVKELEECLGEPDTAKTLVDLLDAILKRSLKLRAAEADCRKNRKCMTHREDLKAGEDICGNLYLIKDAQAGIQAERSNPSGVVDLARLHEFGDTIRMFQSQVKEQKAEFRKTYKRAFLDSICTEIWAKPRTKEGN